MTQSTLERLPSQELLTVVHTVSRFTSKEEREEKEEKKGELREAKSFLEFSRIIQLLEVV